MLEKILKLYTMSMAYDVRSPMPHLFGPPGCGKSSVVQQAADLIGCKLHIINVSRISPLELEGVQMPVDHVDGMKLSLLTATFWTQLREGDILLFDEMLRGFPEVYNGLLDIVTSRQVGGFMIPKVFMLGASNSTVAYDKALEDRLLHLPVPDPRWSKPARKQQAQILVDALGLLPDMVDSAEMASLLDTEVLPMYALLDQLGGKGNTAPGVIPGVSLRNLIGQAQLREVTSFPLNELISMNNAAAMRQNKEQYVLLLNGKPSALPQGYVKAAQALQGNPRLTEIQVKNLELNLQLVELEAIRYEKEAEDGDIFVDEAQPF